MTIFSFVNSRPMLRLGRAEDAVSSLDPSSDPSSTSPLQPVRAAAEPDELAVILAGCRARQSDAFERLFVLYKDYVYSVALYLTRDAELAADVVQEVFLKLVDKIDRFHGRARWTTWLYRVVCNTVRDAQRRQKTTVPLEALSEASLPAAESDVVGALAQRDTATLVRTAVEQLGPRLREPLVLRYVAGLRYAEIAEVLGISVGTVASRLNRAHERLAAAVPREEVELS